MIIDINEYKELFDLYQIDINTGKSKIPDVDFRSNLRFHKANNEMLFGFTLAHNLSDFSYDFNFVRFNINDEINFKYRINSKFKYYEKQISSKKILSFDEIVNEFNKGIENNYSGIAFNYHFYNYDIITLLNFDKEYNSNGSIIKYAEIKYENNFIHLFKLNHQYTDIKEIKYDQFLIQIYYNGYWIRVHNDEFYLMKFDGEFMPPSNMNVLQPIKSIKFNHIPKLFVESSFNELMSIVETEIVFS